MSNSFNNFWLISAPGDPTKQETVQKLKEKVSNPSNNTAQLADVYAFALPEFKIGTLDALYVLSDDLAKLDPSLESVAIKIADNMKMLLNNDMQQWRSSLVVNESKFDSSSPQTLNPDPSLNPSSPHHTPPRLSKKSRKFRLFKRKFKLNHALRPTLACALSLSVPYSIPPPAFTSSHVGPRSSLSSAFGKPSSSVSPVSNFTSQQKPLTLQFSSVQESIELYLNAFQWNVLKYRADKSLRELTDSITQEVNHIDNLMKSKMQAYTQIKTQLTGYLRKQNGNLAIKSLNGVVRKEHFVLDSEYLTTLLVAVPRSLENEWFSSYESLTQMIVPRSSQKIAEDDEYALFNVTLFQKVVDEFMQKARDFKFVVRDFKWDEKALAQEKEEAIKIGAAEKELWTSLLRLCKTNFGEVFQCVMHLKALRVYVESILRYGLPPNFQPMLLKFNAKNERKLKDTLNAHYVRLAGHAQGSKGSSSAADGQLEENIASLLGEKDFSPYVLFNVPVPQ